MTLTSREIISLLHGMFFGGLFLILFSGGWMCLRGLNVETLQASAVPSQLKMARIWTLAMASLSWLTVLIGAYVIYPWYRAKAPAGADLALYPQAALNANPELIGWHNFGMEWKEHVAWFAPLIATVVAYLVWKHGRALSKSIELRRICLALYSASFVAAAIAGLFGALITKAAAIH